MRVSQSCGGLGSARILADICDFGIRSRLIWITLSISSMKMAHLWRGRIGGNVHARETTKPDRHPCGRTGPTTSHDPWNEPGKARRESRHHIPTSPEIREGHQPDRREPPGAYRAGSEGSGVFLLRGYPGTANADGRSRT